MNLIAFLKRQHQEVIHAILECQKIQKINPSLQNALLLTEPKKGVQERRAPGGL